MSTLCVKRSLAMLSLVIGAAVLGSGCGTKKWPMFRYNAMRTADQTIRSDLSNPAKVATLHVAPGWPVSPSGAVAFRASPIVWKTLVLIGNGNGRFYAFDRFSGAQVWQYPPSGSPALTSQFTCNPSSTGIAASAAFADIKGTKAVIFAAPDRSIGAGFGSGRVFALDAKTGAEIWKSPEIAQLTGTAPGSTTQEHQQIGYSSPLVLGDRIYVGIADHCDNPIQRGRVVSLDLGSGTILSAFSFFASGPPRGGGVWSPVSGFADAVYVTTGNTNIGGPEPPDNHGLSMLRLDGETGGIDWKLQPVPYALDGDPDWSSGASIMLASCGVLAVSTMKDGWTYAVRAGDGTPGPPSVAWQFPPTGFPFTPADGTVHGDTRYLRPGAVWKDVFITMTGGLGVTGSVGWGLSRLHALNACAKNADRVRWIKDVPGACPGIDTSTGSGRDYCLGPPTVTRGIVYVGTTSGRLVAIADPTVSPAEGRRCSNPGVPNWLCPIFGIFLGSMVRLVDDPAVLADVQLDGAILTEPALMQGKVYVATSSGKLYMLEP